jgi:hypothetical protein
MSNIYQIMLPKSSVGSQPFFDIDNLNALQSALDILESELVAMNNQVKATLDTLKTAQFPDFEPNELNPALMCSVV